MSIDSNAVKAAVQKCKMGYQYPHPYEYAKAIIEAYEAAKTSLICSVMPNVALQMPSYKRIKDSPAYKLGYESAKSDQPDELACLKAAEESLFHHGYTPATNRDVARICFSAMKGALVRESSLDESPMELLKLLGYVNAMVGYCQSLKVGTVINDAYMQRMNDHYIPNTQKTCMLIAGLVNKAQLPVRESGSEDHWDIERFKKSPWFTGYANDESKGVYKLALAMCDKMSTKKAEGYTGWDDEDECPNERLVSLLLKHIPKGDPVDIANFCMMLHYRGVTNFKNYLRERPTTQIEDGETK